MTIRIRRHNDVADVWAPLPPSMPQTAIRCFGPPIHLLG
jgi:hypothetical protein